MVMAICILIIKQCQKNKGAGPRPKVNNPSNPKDPSSVDRDRGFDRRISYIKYSEHARCRMDCRHITQSEVEEIMKDGKINYSKSDIQNARCPRYALDGTTHDNQRVRMIFAQCNESTTVVTVIDLGTEWQCHCPGDDDKYINRN